MSFSFRNHLLVEAQREDQPATVIVQYQNEKNGTVVFTENHKDGYIAVGFKGKSSKPEFNIRFTSEANRSKHIEKFIAQDKLRQAQKDEEKAKRNAFVPSCVVGDVFAGTWGFEQTNVSFYQVIAIKNKSVVLRQLEMDKQFNGEMSMTGKAYPLVNQFSSNEIKKVVQVGDQIKISDYLTVKLIKPLKSLGKTPVYEGISFSEYA